MSEYEGAPTHQSITYCPYCAEENLFPTDTGWECRACLRTFSVTFLGLGPRTPAAATTGSSTSPGETR